MEDRKWERRQKTEDDRQEKTHSLKKLYQNAILRVLMLMTCEHIATPVTTK